MRWRKHSHIFCGAGENPLMQSGGRTPSPLHLEGDIFRIFFATYDEQGRGRIFSMLYDVVRATIVEIVAEPLLGLGNVGFFDDNGIIPSCALQYEEEIYLYTIGFSVKNKVIFDAATGLARSSDGGLSFRKLHGPVIDRTVTDPCFAASPSVIHDDGMFKMWYVSCERWEPLPAGGYQHFYNIKYKTSRDGIHWPTTATVAIDFENSTEYAISRPWVMKDGPKDYKMWYSFRAQPGIATYRIGFARSEDGVSWTRCDADMSHFSVSENGWDSEMLCYPSIFDHKGVRYMLYNGNGYGRSGFGLAVLDE